MFGADQVRGSGSCNSYGGAYRFDSATGQIEFQNLGMTAMACAEQARNEYEGVFSAALVRASSASFDSDGRLVLSGPAGRIVLAPAG